MSQCVLLRGGVCKGMPPASPNLAVRPRKQGIASSAEVA